MYESRQMKIEDTSMQLPEYLVDEVFITWLVIGYMNIELFS
jgi:hypothetical protein